jgi:hypothetical protein
LIFILLERIEVSHLKTKILKKMEGKRIDAPWFKPGTVMSSEELKAACEGQILYPRVVQKRVDPPVPDQNFCCLSFMHLPEPKNGVSAFVKVRGVKVDEKEIKEHAIKLVKEVDSKFPIKIAPVGKWVPVTEGDQYDKDELLIREDLEDGKIQEDPIKLAEEKHKQRIKQLQERKEQLKDQSAKDDPYSDKDGIDYYTMRQVTIMNIKRYISEGEEKLRKLQEDLDKIVVELEDLDVKHPEYQEQWVQLYNEKREKVGMAAYDPATGHDFA